MSRKTIPFQFILRLFWPTIPESIPEKRPKQSRNRNCDSFGIGIDTALLFTTPLPSQVWDTGGQQRYRPVLSTCYRNAHGVIVVFDVTNAVSFANLQQWIDEIAGQSERGDWIPVLLGYSVIEVLRFHSTLYWIRRIRIRNRQKAQYHSGSGSRGGIITPV